MKIQYCSDLHLEFPENRNFLKSNPLKPAGDILVLAGDIVPFVEMDKHSAFFDHLADNFETTYWIPGNHEYYHSDISERSGMLNEKIRSNVLLINNQAVEVNKTKLIFSTLWAHISPVHEWKIKKNMSDFHVITYQGKPFSTDTFNQLHEESRAFLATALQNIEDCETIVVTHHVPTLINYPQRYEESLLNEAFVVELFDLIEGSGIDYWMYGHTHANTQSFTIGNTQMLTNQLGYVEYNEHQDFDIAKTISIKAKSQE
jgi:predicted phosphohydrolase